MKTCKEMAKLWGVTERTVTTFCKTGKIPGAVKEGKSWRIPDEAEKPVDGRVLSGKYVKKEEKEARKPLPIGISDYVRAQSEYYYVDKTGMIKEFLDRRPLVSLFTRPRRFGKTLNMDMLRVFFEISDTDTSQCFRDKEIWKCGEEYREHQGKYPVIFLTFKDIKFASWELTFAKIAELVQEEFGRHKELGMSEKLEPYEKDYFRKILAGQANEVELSSSLQKLSKMLHEHYGKAPIIMIDEYDAPIQEGYSKKFYEEIIGFMRNFFSGAFKDNRHLSYGFLTGILRIAQGCIPKAYWVNTGKNEILEEVLKAATEDVIEKLYALLQGERVVARIDQNVVYRSLLEEPSSIYSLLLVAGYLKTPKKELQTDGSYLCEVSIPNWEIAAVYKAEILSHLLQIGAVTRTTADRIAESLYTNDVKKLQSAIAEYMDKSISFYDAGAEGFYHGLVLGLIALLDQQYKITSNREFREGRYDISLFPRELRYPGILMELKWKKGITEDTLKKLAKEALNQIETQRYDAEMRQEGVTEIIKLGIAFSGKNVKIWTV